MEQDCLLLLSLSFIGAIMLSQTLQRKKEQDDIIRLYRDLSFQTEMNKEEIELLKGDIEEIQKYITR